MKKTSTFLISIFFIWLSGCAAFGVPYTSDPYEKLGLAKELFNRQGRPLPAERLIREAIEICNKTNDSKCQAEAYFAYSSFFKSPSVEKWRKNYQRNGFMDETATFETRLAKSEEYFNKAISLNPEIYLNRGIAYYDNGQLELAFSDFDKTIALAPKSEWAYVNRGAIYDERGQYDQAIADYDKAIFLKPDFAKAYNNRGNSYRTKGQYDHAIADYDKAVSLDQNDSRTYLNRGFTFFYMRQFDQAVNDFERAAKINPDDAYPHVWIYLASFRKGLDGRATFKNKSHGLDLKKGLGPLISLYFDELSPKEMVKKTEDSIDGYQAVEFFHIGQYYLLKANKPKAMEMFRRAIIATDAPGVFEHEAAKMELERILKGTRK
jgi:tetratricopeptide (TPR) repeat protein